MTKLRAEWVLEFRAAYVLAARRLWEASRQTAKRKRLAQLEAALETAAAEALLAQGQALVKRLARIKDRWPTVEALRLRSALEPGCATLREAGGLTEDDWGPLWDEAADEGDAALEQAIVEGAKAALRAGAETALALAAKEVLAQYGISWTLENPRAVAYLQAHGAELVTRIDETTRGELRSLIQAAMEQGRSYDQLAKDIQRQFKGYGDPNSYWRFDAPRPQGHIDSRAHLIAVTEIGGAYEDGEWQAMQEMQAAGLTVVKWWSTMGDERVSAGCQENEAEGEIPLDQPHASGHQHPLRFPGCRCTENYDVQTLD